MKHPSSVRPLLPVALAASALAASARAGEICVTPLPLAPSGGSGVAFGRAVAVDGGLALVCADTEAHAYAWNGTAWVQEAILSIPGAESGFGASAALSGDTALIGCPLQDGAFVDQGRALVFVRSGPGAWSLETELTASGAAANDRFGSAVALEGNRAVVGDPGDDAPGANAGSVRVFERSAAVWTETAALVPTSVAAAGLGTTVALSGDTALASSASFLGGVFAFVEAAGSWSEQQALAASLLLPGQVALDGDRAVVGGLVESLVYERSGGTWTETDALPFTGVTAALEGDVLLLGNASCPTTPAVRVFVQSGGAWEESAALAVEGASMPLALSGLRAVVGTRGGLACSGGLASAFHLVLAGPPPSVAHRNAGTNPDSYVALVGSYGETLDLTIDLATTGHALGLVIGFDSPFQLPLPGGQTLLCLDLMGSGELLNTGFRPGPLVHLVFPLPNDPAFAGFTFSTQAMHAFTVTPFALSNAQDITIGGCP